jgi:integrase
MSLYFTWGIHPLDGKKPPGQRRKVKIWRYDFEVHGRRHAGSFGKVSATRAKELYMAKHAEVTDRGHVATPRRRPRTVAEVAHDFDAWFAMDHRPATIASWHVCWKSLAPLVGARLIASLTIRDLEHVQQTLRRSLAPASVNKRLAFLQQICKKARQWGDVSADPFIDLKKLRVPRKRPRNLTPDEEARILSACNPQLRLVVIAALLTGLRRNELCQLRWRDLDLDRATILIPPEINKTDEVASQPIPSALVAILRPLQGRPDDRVFGYRDFGKSYRRAVKRSGVTPPPTFHDLRKTFGSRLAQAGENLRTIQELLRHKTISQTQIYVDLLPSTTRRAVENLPGPPDALPERPRNSPSRTDMRVVK